MHRGTRRGACNATREGGRHMSIGVGVAGLGTSERQTLGTCGHVGLASMRWRAGRQRSSGGDGGRRMRRTEDEEQEERRGKGGRKRGAGGNDEEGRRRRWWWWR